MAGDGKENVTVSRVRADHLGQLIKIRQEHAGSLSDSELSADELQRTTESHRDTWDLREVLPPHAYALIVCEVANNFLKVDSNCWFGLFI